ncbi:heavy metal translocatin [Mollisia scopiformis]|uniref:Heavy metal translocatin n=1 Tax=Mollisia scopiformis TaxID=149040 RepID=A0A194WUZ8_MOLSC|nr:heavy metal translocatin [Mollisia scopiformis]KUJ11796.1 heavy metal translocatin [Mollisia scopiformis]
MSNPTEPADPSHKCCDGCTMNRSSNSNTTTSFGPITAAINSSNVTEPCNEGCCSGNKDLVEEATEDDCCGGNELLIEDKYQVTCCSGEEKEAADDGCQDLCCSGENEKSNGRRGLSACCEGKASPCCDASCIDRIAMRECKSNCSEDFKSNGLHTEGTACEAHKKRTRHKYAAKLAAFDCICRALIALGQESCCIPKAESSVPRGSTTRKWSPNSDASDACCKPRRQKTPLTVTGEASGRPASTKLCSDEFTSVVGIQPVSADIEKGCSGVEHMVLSITGMTCTGCETKLQRVLGTLPPITNLKTSLVIARAEFNLDTAIMSPDAVMKHLERTTEFKCERILTQGSNLEVIPRGNVKDFLGQLLPLGVNDMQLVGKGIVRINFDPKVIGARSLIENNLEYPCSLAPPPVDPGLAAGSKHVREMGYMTLLSIVLTVPVLVLSWAPLRSRPITYGAVSLALATIIQLVIAGPFYPKALKSLVFSRMIEMDLLIVFSTSAAYIFSVVSFGYLVSGHPLLTGEFFETSTLLVTLIMVGRFVAALSRQKAVQSITIRSLQISTAQLVTKDGTSIDEIDTRLLQYGDFFTVLPEHRVPTDGVVISGSSEIDESMLTGESRPSEKQVGSKIIAGSINGSGKLVIQLTHLPGENTISVIAGMVDNAKLSKPKIQDFADRVASYFVPVIVSLTILTFVVWISVGIAIQKKSGSDAAIQAIIFAITVLIVSCPCAIGLAVPMVIVIGSGVAAERGVIFKSADSIEMAYKTTHIVFDKTGTLTEGRLKVAKEQYIMENDVASQSMILSLVSNSKHPVSVAVATYLEGHGTTPTKIDDIKTVAGKGIEGKAEGKLIRGGNARWLDAESDGHVQFLAGAGYTLFCITLDSKLYAVFGLSDTVRPEATATVAKLRQRGIQLSLLSGDDIGPVQQIAAEVGINSDEVRSRCSPSDKQQYIQSLLRLSVGKTKSTVVFVGDGTNDAVALAQATIGVHMSSGTDVAQSAADVVLMRQSLEGILTIINISQAAVRRIKFNFGWSFVYNVLALLFASGALVNARNGVALNIPPQYAGLGELVSVLPVIAIAVGLRLAKI